jgi:GT2 family glycosyltransferase
MSVTVVIPVYKNKDKLETCLSHLKAQKEPISDIKTYDDTESRFGFVKAVNGLIRPLMSSKQQYVVVLNQDCYLKPNAVEEMVKFMDENPKCAIGGIKHLLPEDEDEIIHGGCTKAFPSGWHITGSVKNGDCAENKQMPWINGACMIVRMEALKDIGVMDENFNMICSDSDWCYTARDRGWEVWYIANAVAVHEHGISKGTKDNSINKKKLQDTVRFRDKWITDGSYRELVMEIFD